MARISKVDYPRILQMADGEKRKVAEIATEYGCTPANIYALLTKLRRDVGASAEIIRAATNSQIKPSLPLVQDDDLAAQVADAAMIMPLGSDLFGIDVPPHEPVAPAAIPAKRRGSDAVKRVSPNGNKALLENSAIEPAVVAQKMREPAAFKAMPEPVATELPRLDNSKKARGMGASLAKPGMALVMRTADGEENLTPFRSLDDLLSAVKPILRAAARSPDAVWFSIQPVDLALLDSDAN